MARSTTKVGDDRSVHRARRSRLPPYRYYAILPFSFKIRSTRTERTIRSPHTAETSVLSLIGLQPTKTHIESGNYHADVIMFDLFAYCSNFDFQYAYGQRGGWTS